MTALEIVTLSVISLKAHLTFMFYIIAGMKGHMVRDILGVHQYKAG